MKKVAFARTETELVYLRENGISEVILGHRELSRLGTLDEETLHHLAEEARKLDLRPILEWDILMTSPDFERAVAVLDGIRLDLFSAIRVQDLGAFEHVLKNYPAALIQLVLETGNLNLESVQRWCEYGGKRLDRVVLSSQLPKARLAHYIQNISVPVEVLGLGPILLLYTPRHLVSNQVGNSDQPIRVTASNDEILHSGFRVVENQHGTFVFHSKDYCLVEQIPELEAMNLGAFRVDRRFEDPSSTSEGFLSYQPSRVTRCFFQANATDVLFKKLKNVKVQRQDDGYLGEVVEIARAQHTIIQVQRPLKKGDHLRFINTIGTEKEWVIGELKNLDQQEVEVVPAGDFAVIPYIKGVPAKSAVYLAVTECTSPAAE